MSINTIYEQPLNVSVHFNGSYIHELDTHLCFGLEAVDHRLPHAAAEKKYDSDVCLLLTRNTLPNRPEPTELIRPLCLLRL